MDNEHEHKRQELNNYLQRKYKSTQRLSWETSSEGPDHQPTWLAIAKFDDVEWGRGTGPSQGAAKEKAAAAVLQALTYH